MGVVIFLLICLVAVLIGFLIKYKNENDTENTTENTVEIKIEEVKELSVDTETIVIDSRYPFPKSNYISSNDYSKYTIQSILKSLLQIQTNPTRYTCILDPVEFKNIYVYDESDLACDTIEDISIEVLTLLKSINFITINQICTPARSTVYDEYGFIVRPQIQSKYKIIIKVTEEGKAYLNS